MVAVEDSTSNKEDRLPGEAKEILRSLAAKWGDVFDSNTLQVIPLKGAMTNEVFQIKWPKSEDVHRKVLARIYGEGVEVFFDRDNEIRTFEFMSKHGQGPRLLGRFSNGRIEEFIHARKNKVKCPRKIFVLSNAIKPRFISKTDLTSEKVIDVDERRTLSASDLRNPETSALIAAKLKEFHDLDMPGSKNVFLWDRLRTWLSAAKRFAPPEEAKLFCLDSMEVEISSLEKELSKTTQRVGFCHNDLQYGNIMLDEETKSITIIDYEYSSYNPVAFDIANHFCEMAADYHTETPHVLDFNKYPGLEERQRFLHIYLTSSGSSGDRPCDIEVEQLLVDVEKYTLASHLVWGLWGIISEHVNEIDFDYKEYARQRLEQYWERRPQLVCRARAI